MINEIKIGQVVNRNIDELMPFPGNPRTHSQDQIHQLVSLITTYGFTSPVIIDDSDTLLAGHGRIQAARLLDMDVVPTVTLHGLSESQKKAYVIADNKVPANADWDVQQLSIVLQEINLSEDDLVIELTGFDEIEIERVNEDALKLELSELSEGTDDEKQTSSGSSSGAGDPMHNFGMKVTSKQQQQIYKAINRAKVIYDTEDTREALIFICMQWLEVNDETNK